MANATLKIEALESVDGVTYVDQEPDSAHNVGVGDHMIDFTSTPGVKFVKFRVTEEGSGSGSLDMIAGIM